MLSRLARNHMMLLGIFLSISAAQATPPLSADGVLRCARDIIEGSGLFVNTMRLGQATQPQGRGPVAIVDAYSSGNLLAAEFRARGYDVIHFRSGMHISTRLQNTFVPRDFSKDYDTHGKAKEALALLQEHSPTLILPGAESGVMFAEKLATAMGTPTNHPRYIGARRNKFRMVESLSGKHFEEAGLFVPIQTRVHSVEAAVEWVKNTLGSWSEMPGAVVKPPLGSGGSQVSLVGSEQELREAVQKVLSSHDHFGNRNSSVVIAQKIVGDEYALNGAVLLKDGVLNVALTDAWHYNKSTSNGDAPTYGHEDLVPFAALPDKTLSALRVGLAGLGYERGGFHEEVIVEKDTGRIYFVEVGARLYGAGNPRIAASCTRYGQVQALADSYLDPANFLRHANQGYELTAHASVFNVSAPASDVPLVVNHAHLPMLRSILDTSLYELIPFFGDGTPIEPTEDLGSTLLQIEIRNADRRRVNGFIEYLRNWQADGYFWRLAP